MTKTKNKSLPSPSSETAPGWDLIEKAVLAFYGSWTNFAEVMGKDPRTVKRQFKVNYTNTMMFMQAIEGLDLKLLSGKLKPLTAKNLQHVDEKCQEISHLIHEILRDG